MRVCSYNKEYDVIIHDDVHIQKDLVNLKNSIYVVDKNFYSLYKNSFLVDISYEKLFLIEATENNKRIETALEICERIIDYKAKRNATIVAIGGGIIQDITGFAANILYRGIKWILIPTTLLSACDSCIGGKTSLNYKGYKNLLGTFYAPDVIHIFPHVFNTLSEVDYMSGLGEVFKFNIMRGQEGIERLENSLGHLLNRNNDTIIEFLHSSLEYKKRIIEQDEFDKAERVYLNYAHTFGHAIEAISGFAIPHGTAVAMGAIAANHISVKMGLLSASTSLQMEKLLKKIITFRKTIIGQSERIVAAMEKDKKKTGDDITIVALQEMIDGEINPVIINNITRDDALEAVEYMISIIGC